MVKQLDAAYDSYPFRKYTLSAFERVGLETELNGQLVYKGKDFYTPRKLVYGNQTADKVKQEVNTKLKDLVNPKNAEVSS